MADAWVRPTIRPQERISALKDQHVIGIIPARWGSTRFPGKPLYHLLGKPLLQHVWERVQGCREVGDLAIATDHTGIRQAAESWGARVIMTSPEHPSGSDRLAEAAVHFPEATHLVNIQGDEPLIDPELIDRLARSFTVCPEADMITAASPIAELEGEKYLGDPNVVKVVLTREQRALYFSRAAIPHRGKGQWGPVLRHVGLYAYRAEFLQRFVGWEPTPLELAESLEQLRALEHGAHIQVLITEHEGIGLDTPEQVPEIEFLLRQELAPCTD